MQPNNYTIDQFKVIDSIAKELFALKNEITMIENNIDNINKTLEISPDINQEDIKTIYNESNIHFSNYVTKRLEELETFYDALLSERATRLREQQKKLRADLRTKKTKATELQKKYDHLKPAGGIMAGAGYCR